MSIRDELDILGPTTVATVGNDGEDEVDDKYGGDDKDENKNKNGRERKKRKKRKRVLSMPKRRKYESFFYRQRKMLKGNEVQG